MESKEIRKKIDEIDKKIESHRITLRMHLIIFYSLLAILASKINPDNTTFYSGFALFIIFLFIIKIIRYRIKWNEYPNLKKQ